MQVLQSSSWVYELMSFLNARGKLFLPSYHENASSRIKFNQYKKFPSALITHALENSLRNEELRVQ